MKTQNLVVALGTVLGLSLLATACGMIPTVQETVTPSPRPPAEETTVTPGIAPLSTVTSRPASAASLAPTAEPTATPLSPTTIEPSPTSPAPSTSVVSQGGVTFALHPTIGDKVSLRSDPDTVAHLEFVFAPEGSCQDVGCITIYPIESYQETIPFGADVIDGLRSAIETQSEDTFPTLMAHVLLRAKTTHLRFQNGAGMRAIVMKGQDTVWANNGSVVYEFHGLTDDGQHYVAATYPIDAPMLLSSCCDPAANTNPAAIPVPELPADNVEAAAVIREYNREAERQLDALQDDGFTPSLTRLDELVRSMLITASIDPTTVPTEPAALLQVDVDYRGAWYRETFSYTKDADHVAHFVLVMPEGQVDAATAEQVFSSIDFSAAPATLAVRAGREEFDWALEHVYFAPEGRFQGTFEPGTYYAAAGFVTAPVTREEAGHADEDILYAGMTGGGASTEYLRIEIEPGQNALLLSLTDADGWACPWLYVYDGDGFRRRTEILRNVRGKENEQKETSPIGRVEIVDGSITLMVAEEKDEITCIDQLYILAEGIEVRADPANPAAARVAEEDDDYLLIANGESHRFRFSLPDAFAGKARADVSVVVSGFYAPLEGTAPSTLDLGGPTCLNGGLSLRE
jgi:hypothetical protein